MVHIRVAVKAWPTPRARYKIPSCAISRVPTVSMLNIMAGPDLPDIPTYTYTEFVSGDDPGYAALSLPDHSTPCLGVFANPSQGEAACDTSIGNAESGDPVLEYFHEQSSPASPWSPTMYDEFIGRASSELAGSGGPSATSNRGTESHEGGDSSPFSKSGELGKFAFLGSSAMQWVIVRALLSVHFEANSNQCPFCQEHTLYGEYESHTNAVHRSADGLPVRDGVVPCATSQTKPDSNAVCVQLHLKPNNSCYIT